jgi:hypothetical protein
MNAGTLFSTLAIALAVLACGDDPSESTRTRTIVPPVQQQADSNAVPPGNE